MNTKYILALTLLVANTQLAECNVKDIKAALHKNPARACKKYEKEIRALDHETRKELWHLAEDLLMMAKTQKEMDVLHKIKDACDNNDSLQGTPTPAPFAHTVQPETHKPAPAAPATITGPKLQQPRPTTPKAVQRQLFWEMYEWMRKARIDRSTNIEKATQEFEDFELNY